MNIVSTDNISLILQAGESNTVEFKTRVSGLPNSLPKIISAFANAEGGVIILGYDECRRFVNGITNNELEVLRKVIRANSLEDVCYTYTVPYKEKILAVVQVEKSKSIIVAGGGAYIRNGINTIPLASKDVIARILSDSETSGTTSSELVLERLEKKVEQFSKSSTVNTPIFLRQFAVLTENRGVSICIKRKLSGSKLFFSP